MHGSKFHMFHFLYEVAIAFVLKLLVQSLYVECAKLTYRFSNPFILKSKWNGLMKETILKRVCCKFNLCFTYDCIKPLRNFYCCYMELNLEGQCGNLNYYNST